MVIALNTFRLRMSVVAVVASVLFTRLMNAAQPHVYNALHRHLVAIGVSTGTAAADAWALLGAYVVLKFVNRQLVPLLSLDAVLWKHLSRDSVLKLHDDVYRHMFTLDLATLNRVMPDRVLDFGADEALALLRYIIFHFFPSVIDAVLSLVSLGLFADRLLMAATAVEVAVQGYSILQSSRSLGLVRPSEHALHRRLVSRRMTENFESVKHFNNEAWEREQFLLAYEKHERSREQFKGGLGRDSDTPKEVVASLSQALLFARVLCGSVDFAGMLAMETYLRDAVSIASDLMMAVEELVCMHSRARSFLDFLAVQSTIADAPGAVPLAKDVQHAIEFDNVTFAYQTDDGPHTVIRGLSVRCPPGRTLAFVGESGGGKSTLARLLFRFYDVDTGAIRVGGHDVRSLTLDSLRHAVGILDQNCLVFDGTVMFNIRYGRQDATDDEVYAAARAACIHKRILALPDGYNTSLGLFSSVLSGGERQRLAIARTILKRPQILILDEPTGMLDALSEEEVNRGLRQLRHGCTTIIIAHRLSTVANADVIAVVDGGRVVEHGSHAELLARGGMYARMWAVQTSGGML
ncbi:P-loop containing nucleoside triphosphate hydrolase protein, partial [Dipodascopsis tothii]|uniref:P-loop containing nucleoside triphosphate hydrolase protein n=1 Tax=Dipodascopsis tothii TaxID=44089 RepID=UPI0034CDA73A